MFEAPPGYEGRLPREWPIPPMDHAAGGKPSAFTAEMGRLILARFAAGETVKQITADPRMPAYCTVYRWLDVHEAFADAWAQVRLRRSEAAQARDLQARIDEASRKAAETELGLRRRWRGGRRSEYTTAMARAICRKIRDGLAVSEVGREPGMPATTTIYRWMRAQPKFRAMYVAACHGRALGLRVLRDQAMDEALEGGSRRAADREMAALGGRMGRLMPKKYLTAV